jgi:RNA 2',3'-cyclic 3'-phosphodiesterase
MNLIRAFIAIHLPTEIQSQLAVVQTTLNKAGHLPVRWVPPANIHLTLKFLGEVNKDQIEKIGQILADITALQPPFQFTVRGCGAFPNIRKPRVIWAGLDYPPALKDLQSAIDRQTAALGFPPEDRPFSPHLTLGRVDPQANPVELTILSDALTNAQIGQLGLVYVDSLVLFRSDLHPGGSIYTPIMQVGFRK